MNEVVKYDNKMNQLAFKNFSSTDLDVLMALCSKMRDEGTNKLTFEFAELKQLMNYKQTSNTKFVEDIERMNNKLMKVTCNFKTETESIMFVLFPTFRTNWKEQTLTVSVNSDFAFMLNEITNNFTRFELEEFVQLKSKYSKNFYRLLKQYRTTGIYKVEVEEFREKMDCPKSYSNKYFMRDVIEPAIKELSQYFTGLACNPIKAKKRGAPIIAYEFSFGQEQLLNDNQKSAIEHKLKGTFKQQKNKFHNFVERNYSKDDFDNLERMLLAEYSNNSDLPGQTKFKNEEEFEKNVLDNLKGE